nr:formylglycine-generating enzyme family protein [Saccharospirillum impatiens]
MFGGIGAMALAGVSIWYATAQTATPVFEGYFSEHSPEVQALIERTLANMVYVEGGSFMMGNVGYEVPEDDPNGEWLEMADGNMSYRIPFPGCGQSCFPVHKVTLSGYYIHKYETTIREYDLYTNTNDLPYIKADQRGKNPNMEPDRAVYLGVDWHAAQEYCLWLADLTGLPFDLPTEAQWEYAARSRGQAVKFATNTGDIELGVNYWDYSTGSYYSIESVGKYPPNPLDLYDMTGNANEWVRDWYSPFAYRQGSRVNPVGPPDGDRWNTRKLSRGFGRGNSDWNGNLLFRRLADEVDYSGNGFRCAIHSERPLDLLLTGEPGTPP